MTADTVGGVWTYSIELALSLAAAGTRVALAALGPPATAEQRAAAGAVPGLRLFQGHYRLPWMDDPWDDVRAAGDWLLQLADQLNPDVVHLSEPVLAELPWKPPTVAVGHSCVLSWWQAVRGEAAPPTWSRYRNRMRAGFEAAGAVVAPSSAMLAALRFYYGVTDGCVIPNGRDPGRFPPGPKDPMVLAAGRLWDPAKNVAALARVAARLAWPVYVAGDQRHPDSGADAGLGDDIRPLGLLPEPRLAHWLARASIYALPARYEPFGLGPLEAALAGCALVLGDIPSLREVWADAAIFVSPNDEAALQSALEALIAYPEYRDAMAARARQRALSYSPKRMAAGYLRLYRALMYDRTARSAETAACVS
ncbi:MAG TPA: glycosyltransferase family 4 protein [Gemmatimonadales bacterium]|nr:glycosyltransferase family 4 protein [Gemmatimonadales bacterium]